MTNRRPPPTNQRSFFDPPPIARKAGPATSAIAAAEITRSGGIGKMEAIALDLIRANPLMTGLELDVIHEAKTGTRSSGAVHKRLKAMELKGVICRGEVRQCSVSGRLAVTWRAV